MEFFDAAATALAILLELHRLLYLGLGVCMGLALGMIPGLGGLVGLTLLLPFTFTLDPYSAMALLMGMHAVIHTGDTIPAVLFGVPGTVGCAATVLDGHPLAKKGQAGRALGASFTASIIGGVIGAALLAASLPLIRPVVLSVGTPELLAICIFGMSLVVVLSGSSAAKGMVAAAFGLLLSFIGMDSQAGVLRWTFDSIYLWEGLPVVAVALGLFAIPELADLLLRRPMGGARIPSLAGQFQGVRDAFRNLWLIMRCSSIGAALGAAPGIPTSIIDWAAYAHASKTVKGAAETFGKGDIRGVIASESSNNAKEGGDLVTTVAFGIPGGAGMVLIMSALLMQGIVPGPDMLTVHADVTFSLVWSLALANIIGGTLCLLFSGQMARLLQVRASLLVPLIIAVVLLGAYQGSRSWGDILIVVAFGLAGIAMKANGWPRPPLLLGFVMGEVVERYMFISVSRYGWEWLFNPIVMGFLALTIFSVARAMLSRGKAVNTELAFGTGTESSEPGEGPPRTMPVFDIVVCVAFLAIFLAAIFTAWQWPADAARAPLLAAAFGAGFAALALLGGWRRLRALRGGPSGHLPADRSALAKYSVSLVAVPVACYAVGLLATVFLFTIAFMRLVGRERLMSSLTAASGVTAALWLVFDRLLIMPWPQSLLGDAFPWLRFATGLV